MAIKNNILSASKKTCYLVICFVSNAKMVKFQQESLRGTSSKAMKKSRSTKSTTLLVPLCPNSWLSHWWVEWAAFLWNDVSWSHVENPSVYYFRRDVQHMTVDNYFHMTLLQTEIRETDLLLTGALRSSFLNNGVICACWLLVLRDLTLIQRYLEKYG